MFDNADSVETGRALGRAAASPARANGTVIPWVPGTAGELGPIVPGFVLNR
jgi:hypothetical protein